MRLKSLCKTTQSFPVFVVIRQEGQWAGVFSAGKYIFSRVSVILMLAIMRTLKLEWWNKSVCYSSRWSSSFQTEYSALIGHLVYQKAGTVTFIELSGNSTAPTASVTRLRSLNTGESKQLKKGEKRKMEEHSKKHAVRLVGVNLVYISAQITGTVMEVDKPSKLWTEYLR